MNTKTIEVIPLSREGCPPDRIHLVGNVVMDTMRRVLPKAQARRFTRFGLSRKGYAYLTLRRPSNLDNPERLRETLEQILWLAGQLPVVFPIHPLHGTSRHGFRRNQRCYWSGLRSLPNTSGTITRE